MQIPSLPNSTDHHLPPSDLSNEFFSIVHLDDDFLIINKQPAVLTMGQARTEPSVLAAVTSYLGPNELEQTSFVAIIGRLDHPVGGLLVVARTSKSADHLWHQLETKRLKKRYEAIVHGSPPIERGELTNWIVKSKRRRRVDVVTEEIENAQKASLTYRVIESLSNFSKVSIELQTGRKHQIRVQLAFLGHPIVGDHKYGSREKFPKGVALSCCELQFQHPVTDEAMRFEIGEPETWCKWRARMHPK